MMFGDMTPEQQYFHETAWAKLRDSWRFWQQGRKARAQESLRDARYYAQKVPAEFMEPELANNLEKFSIIITRGY